MVHVKVIVGPLTPTEVLSHPAYAQQACFLTINASLVINPLSEFIYTELVFNLASQLINPVKWFMCKLVKGLKSSWNIYMVLLVLSSQYMWL